MRQPLWAMAGTAIGFGRDPKVLKRDLAPFGVSRSKMLIFFKNQ